MAVVEAVGAMDFLTISKRVDISFVNRDVASLGVAKNLTHALHN
jgi:hypothetical protein